MKVGVIGAGMWGINHVRTLHSMGALGAVVEMSDNLRDAAKEVAPSTPVFGDLDEFLASEENDKVSAFVIATPAHTHAQVGHACLEAGKHILVEKPMTLSVDDAEELIRLADSASRTLMVGHLLLFQPAIAFIRDFLKDGKLGDVYHLHQVRAKLGRARVAEDVLWSFGVHDIAVLLNLVGEAPTKVSSSGYSSITEGITDDVHLNLEWDTSSISGLSKVTAHLHNSWLWPTVERKLTVVGSKGMLVYNELEQNVVLHRKTINKDLKNQDAGEEIIFEGADQPLRLELEHFIECCETELRPIANGENGLEVIRVLATAA